jgi:hypothetical protein
LATPALLAIWQRFDQVDISTNACWISPLDVTRRRCELVTLVTIATVVVRFSPTVKHAGSPAPLVTALTKEKQR